MISLMNPVPCEAWIVEDSARKVSDLQNTINFVLEDSPCGMPVPCMANTQFTCGSDPSLISYE